MVTVEELLNLINMTLKLRLFEDGNEKFTGYTFLLTESSPELWERCKHAPVKKLDFYLDIRHKEWRERGLTAPIEPENLATYQYSDMMEELYYVIHI